MLATCAMVASIAVPAQASETGKLVANYTVYHGSNEASLALYDEVQSNFNFRFAQSGTLYEEVAIDTDYQLSNVSGNIVKKTIDRYVYFDNNPSVDTSQRRVIYETSEFPKSEQGVLLMNLPLLSSNWQHQPGYTPTKMVHDISLIRCPAGYTEYDGGFECGNVSIGIDVYFHAYAGAYPTGSLEIPDSGYAPTPNGTYVTPSPQPTVTPTPSPEPVPDPEEPPVDASACQFDIAKFGESIGHCFEVFFVPTKTEENFNEVLATAEGKIPFGIKAELNKVLSINFDPAGQTYYGISWSLNIFGSELEIFSSETSKDFIASIRPVITGGLIAIIYLGLAFGCLAVYRKVF